VNFKNEKKPDVELNLAPLIDVVFLLLIFFMVSTTFERQSAIRITLPEATRSDTEQEQNTITVSIDARGKIFVNDNPLLNAKLSTIRDAVRDAANNMHDPVLIINADENTTHQSVVRVMDAARQASLTRVVFATRDPEG